MIPFYPVACLGHSSAIADNMTQTGHRIKWDHFDILATGQSDIHCKINETLFIRDLKPALKVAPYSFTIAREVMTKAQVICARSKENIRARLFKTPIKLASD